MQHCSSCVATRASAAGVLADGARSITDELTGELLRWGNTSSTQNGIRADQRVCIPFAQSGVEFVCDWGPDYDTAGNWCLDGWTTTNWPTVSWDPTQLCP